MIVSLIRPWGVPRRLGQASAEEAWFVRAKTAIVKYDGLVIRARLIANPDVQQSLLARYHGDPKDSEGALYRRNSVAYNVAEAESYTPANYLIFREPDVKRRVEQLEDWNRRFEADVAEAERLYGILSAPVLVERTAEGERSAAIVSTTLLVATGAAILLGLGYLFFGGK